jgi:hypothetical protein
LRWPGSHGPSSGVLASAGAITLTVMSPLRPLRICAAATGLCALLVLTSCGDPDTESGTGVDAAIAAVLADSAERLAAHVDAGNECEALTEAELLFSRTREAVGDGRVSAEVAREVEDVAAQIAAGLQCAEPSPEPSPQVREDDRGAGGGAGEGRGKGNGGGKGKGGGGKGK